MLVVGPLEEQHVTQKHVQTLSQVQALLIALLIFLLVDIMEQLVLLLELALLIH